jgi:DNA-binding LacI/PurR family transcriptional regulator
VANNFGNPSPVPTKPRAPCTIRDVAALANVSKATVSRYLRGRPYVSVETARRVERAVRRLDYKPNKLAQALTTRQTTTVGVVVPSLMNPFYPTLIAGVGDVAGASGFTVLLAVSNGDAASEFRIVRSMVQRSVEGIVIASTLTTPEDFATLLQCETRIVLASRNHPAVMVDTVVIDSTAGGRMATQHLLAHGHRRIAFVSASKSVAPFRDRYQGYIEALSHAGIDTEARLVLEVPIESAQGYASIARLLSQPEAPTAIFAATDELAITIMDVCRGLHLETPGALALVGFDNTWVAGLPRIDLTTIDGQCRAVGAEAANLLFRRIKPDPANSSQDAVSVILSPSLVTRRTCGCGLSRRGGGMAVTRKAALSQGRR